MGLGVAMAASALPSLAQGIYGFVAHRKYADLLSKQTMTIPTGITEAESMLRRNAASGIYGKDLMEQSINNMMPTFLSAAKKSATGPGALLKALVDAQGSSNKSMMQLNVDDMQARQANLKELSSFLSTTKAQAQQKVEQFNIDKILSAQRERMLAGKELISGIGNALGSGMSTLNSGNYAATNQGFANQNDWMKQNK